MGAIVDGIQPRAAAVLDPVEDRSIQLDQFAFVDQSPSDGGLIADDGQKHPGRFQLLSAAGTPFEQADLLRADQETLVVDQHAVAIEEYGPTKGGHM